MSKALFWASDLKALADFYVLLLDASEKARGADFIELLSEDNSVIVHQIPLEYLPEYSTEKHGQIRSDAAIKPIFTVASISLSLSRIDPEFRKPSGESFNYSNYLCQDLIDPEGNVIQIQENLSA